MPGFNRTGPEGQGSRTGRGLGKCNPNNQKSDEQMRLEDYPIGRSRVGGVGKGQGRKYRRRIS